MKLYCLDVPLWNVEYTVKICEHIILCTISIFALTVVCDLSDFDGEFSFGKQSSEFTQNGIRDKKNPVSISLVQGNAMLMREVKGEWPYWFVLTQITTLYNYGE